MSCNDGDSSAVPVSGEAAAGGNSNPAVTVARAGVDPIPSNPSASVPNTTAQLEQEAIGILKRLACMECTHCTTSVEAGGSPSDVVLGSFSDVRGKEIVDCFGLRVVRGQNHCEAEGKRVPSGSCIEENCEKCQLRLGGAMSIKVLILYRVG